MNRRAFLLSAVLAGAAIGIGASIPQAMAEDKHEHGDGHDHGKEHEGAKTELGSQKIGSYDVQVVQIGAVTPGEEAIFVIRPKGQGEPKAVRAWVGVESGQGSIRTKAEEEKEGEWHAHHAVSKPLPPNSKLWVEVETGTGKQKGSYALKQAS